MGFKFLSDGWFEEAERLRAEINPAVPDAMKDLVINLQVTAGPDGDIEAKMVGGRFEKGLDDGAPTKLTVPFEVAKKMFIEQDQNAAMQAFMSGEIKVEGDMSKMMAMGQGAQPNAEQDKLQELIRAMTE